MASQQPKILTSLPHLNYEFKIKGRLILYLASIGEVGDGRFNVLVDPHTGLPLLSNPTFRLFFPK